MAEAGGAYYSSYSGGYGGGASGNYGTGYNSTYRAKGGTISAGGAGGGYSYVGTSGTFGNGGSAYVSTSSYNRSGGGRRWLVWWPEVEAIEVHHHIIMEFQEEAGGSGWVYTQENYSSWSSANSTDASQYTLKDDSQYYLSNTQLVNGGTSFTSPSGTSETGHTGNGYARITNMN